MMAAAETILLDSGTHWALIVWLVLPLACVVFLICCVVCACACRYVDVCSDMHKDNKARTS